MELAIDFGITNTDILVSNKTERIYSSIPSEEINDKANILSFNNRDTCLLYTSPSPRDRG